MYCIPFGYFCQDVSLIKLTNRIPRVKLHYGVIHLNEVFMTDLGNAIRRRRKEIGLSQEQLAEVLGVTKSTISKYELGQRDPGLDQLVPLAEALNCTIFDLITEPYHKSIKYGFDAGYDLHEEEFHDEVSFAYDELQRRKNDPQYIRMLLAFNNLNTDGQQRAVEYTEALVLTGRYQPVVPPKPLFIEDANGFVTAITELPKD